MTYRIAHAGSSVSTRLATIILGSLLMTAAAKIQVPFYPVPMSMQSAVAVGLGLTLGSRLGAAAVFTYLLQGVAGFPVFASPHAAGISYLMGPTGGYILGFVCAAAVAGALRDWSRGKLPRIVIATTAASLSVYGPGLFWLGAYTGYGEGLLAAGVVPFLLGDALKIVLVACATQTSTKLLRKPGGNSSSCA
ncbi:biotin transporter BioY [Chelatococcus asaccharovorans]|uniref:Biotin transporter n=1 Tax=Chelatococcus asaccharovorans TaxID=28210 RepID=A0A2V3TTD4_9HYPH|nr:biotin transporter BioY [Chelatococcus asaccharovorans]MBS7707832.1 biotin transporter BioY [Chelatococcus asaccharovorans]PXW50921.1 biotin transport system substrate-specific component [Chelatococcus asaccharovorans]